MAFIEHSYVCCLLLAICVADTICTHDIHKWRDHTCNSVWKNFEYGYNAHSLADHHLSTEKNFFLIFIFFVFSSILNQWWFLFYESGLDYGLLLLLLLLFFGCFFLLLLFRLWITLIKEPNVWSALANIQLICGFGGSHKLIFQPGRFNIHVWIGILTIDMYC